MSTLEPISNCFRPIHFFNKSLGRDFLVPCGKCLACRLSKDSKYSMLSALEMQSNKYALFFTLTYDNDNVPLYYYAEDSFSYGPSILRLYSNRDGASVDFNRRDFRNFNFSLLNIPRGAAFPYVCRSDVQKFLKRLRININRTLYKKVEIRYLISAEYGPKTYRPHYHGIIYFNDSDLLTKTTYNYVNTTTLLSQLIAKSWPFADSSRTQKYATIVDTGAGNYVSSYSSSSCNLPRFLQYPETRPWCPAHSKNFGFSKVQKEEIYKNVLSGDYQLHRTDIKTKHVTDVPFSASSRNRLFPRFSCYSKFSTTLQRYLLSVCSGKPYHVAKSGLSFPKVSLYDTSLIKDLKNTDATLFFNREDRPPTLYSCYDFCKDFTTYEKIINSPMLTPAFKHVFKACKKFMEYSKRSSDYFFTCCDNLTRFYSLQLLKQQYNLQKIYLDNGYKNIDWHYPLDFWKQNSDVVRLSCVADINFAATSHLGFFYSPIFSDYKQDVNSLVVNKMRTKSHNDLYKFHNLLKTY